MIQSSNIAQFFILVLLGMYVIYSLYKDYLYIKSLYTPIDDNIFKMKAEESNDEWHKNRL